MTGFTRYAIYAVPQGAFYDRGAAWLGWDSKAAKDVAHPDLPGLPLHVAEITKTPRKYGFHGTIKPPFRLQDDSTEDALRKSFAGLCGRLATVTVSDLVIRRLGGFVAAVPEKPSEDLAALAAEVVERMDDFRAPLTEAELERRRKSGLSERQEDLLEKWGYPYVMEEFRFHLTLTGRLPEAEGGAVAERLAEVFAPVLPRPYLVDDLCLLGEAEDGRFHVIDRVLLGG